MNDETGPFYNRPTEWELYQPLIGKTMLELGNKKNGLFTYKAYFESIGFAHTSIDWNGKDGALSKDLRYPLGLGTFDMVTNIGTTEHVSEQSPVWRNILDAMHVGSVLVSTTPMKPDWWWHGEWYPELEFYRDLAVLNGLCLDRLYIANEAPRRMIFARLTRVQALPFTMPEGGMHRNMMGAR